MNRLHPLVGLVRALQYASYGAGLAVFLLSIAGMALDGGAGSVILVPLLAVGLALGAAYGVLSYLRYTYEVTEDTFDVSRGVVGRQEREIPHARIQNVDVTRNVWQNLLGLGVVRIETAGGGSTEARLDFVSAAEADRLERILRERRAIARRKESDGDTNEVEGVEEGPDANAADEPTEGEPAPTGTDGASPAMERPAETLFALSGRELALHAVTTFRPGLLVVLAIGTPIVEDLIARVLLRAAAPLGGPERLVLSALTPDEIVALSVVGAPLGIATAWAIGIALGLNQYFGFTLGQRGEELVYERGLLSTYSGTIPLGKVQTLTVTENVLQRALGYAGLSVDTAGYAGGEGGGNNRSAIPLAERDRVDALIDIVEGADLDAAFERPPKRARSRYVARYGIVLALALGITFAVSRSVGGFSLWWMPALLAPALPVFAHYKWKHRGYALGEDHLLVRSGFLRRRTQVVPYRRLQTVSRSMTVFQRRRDLATLIADTASGAVLARGGAVVYDQSTEVAVDLREGLRERLQASLRK